MDALGTLREEAASCRACDLWRNATQTVFGQGPHNRADRAGRRAARHFKWQARGKRRIHQRPNAAEDTDFAAVVVATIHPSAILRLRDEDRDEALAALTADLQVMAGLAASG